MVEHDRVSDCVGQTRCASENDVFAEFRGTFRPNVSESIGDHKQIGQSGAGRSDLDRSDSAQSNVARTVVAQAGASRDWQPLESTLGYPVNKRITQAVDVMPKYNVNTPEM